MCSFAQLSSFVAFLFYGTIGMLQFIYVQDAWPMIAISHPLIIQYTYAAAIFNTISAIVFLMYCIFPKKVNEGMENAVYITVLILIIVSVVVGSIIVNNPQNVALYKSQYYSLFVVFCLTYGSYCIMAGLLGVVCFCACGFVIYNTCSPTARAQHSQNSVIAATLVNQMNDTLRTIEEGKTRQQA